MDTECAETSSRLFDSHLKSLIELNEHGSNTNFVFEKSVDGQESLHLSDVMICDWSGAALDYAFGLGKPVVFIDVPRKVNNADYEELGIEPFEAKVRSLIGEVIEIDDIARIPSVLESISRTEPTANHVYSIGESSVVGAQAILDIINRDS